MRWCMYIDILGFSQLWESKQSKTLHALGVLMQSIYRVGTRVYADEGERLFVHHMGDGFAIVSDFEEASFERPLGIAAALMRHLASTGAFAAAVSEGELSDITGCYPPIGVALGATDTFGPTGLYKPPFRRRVIGKPIHDLDQG